LRLKPPAAPVTEDERINIVMIMYSLEDIIKVTGAIFCQVSKIAPWIQFTNSITWGNQKWVGAIPDLIPRATETRLLEGEIMLAKEGFISRRLEKIIKTEARAWVIKYLMAASDLEEEEDIVIRGIKDIRLISRANQAINHEEEEQAISVLAIRMKMIIRK